MGPGPGALIYVCLTFWQEQYDVYDEFPYPMAIEKCFVQGEFIGFKYQGVVPYWHVYFKAFNQKLWVKEVFFMSDVWMMSVTSKTYLVTAEQYNEFEVQEKVTDSDLEEHQSETWYFDVNS